jgi:hypothetical protein
LHHPVHLRREKGSSRGNGYLAAIHNRHLSTRASVLAFCNPPEADKSSITPGRDYDCGCKIAAALTGAEIYHFWTDTIYGRK